MTRKERKLRKKKSHFESPQGMGDVLPAEHPYWEKVRRVARDIADCYNYSRIETPLIEHKEVFEIGMGNVAEIVEDRLFLLEKKETGIFALRPEARAGICRAYIENGPIVFGQPARLFWEGPVFHRTNANSGRFEESYLADYEIISQHNDPVYDAQIMLAGFRMLESLRLKGVRLSVNTIGCKHCRPQFKKDLRAYFLNNKEQLCRDCKEGTSENPFHVLACASKDEIELKREAPIALDYLCAPCNRHFKSVLEYADELRLPYTLENSLVRGFDFHTNTVFEYFADGMMDSLGGGGRYNYLIEMLGGRNTPAVGVSLKVENIISALKAQTIIIAPKEKKKVFLAHIGELAKRKSLSLIETLRSVHIGVYESLGKDSLKAQLKLADKKGAEFALIFGQKEAFEDAVIVRNLKTGSQETVPLRKIGDVVKRKLK